MRRRHLRTESGRGYGDVLTRVLPLARMRPTRSVNPFTPSMKYFLWIEGKETGPYEQREVEAAVADETIYSDTLARRETGISWDPIETLLPSVKDVTPVKRANSKTAAVIEPASRPPVKAMSRGQGVFVTLLLLCVLALLIWDFVKPPVRFEYRTVVIPTGAQKAPGLGETAEASPDRVDEAELTELGGAGWELAGSYLSAQAPKEAEGDAALDLLAETAAKPVVLLFKRPERNHFVTRYIDPLWRGDVKSEAKAVKVSAGTNEAKVEEKSDAETSAEGEPVTEAVREIEGKEVLPAK
jgi:hypothetical protein